jgi:CheY-like chemotaxis protein
MTPGIVDAELRHFVRNRLAALRNAAFYLQRRVEPTPVAAEDPRISQFFALIIHELAEIEHAISGRSPGTPIPSPPVVDTAKLAVRVLIVDDHSGNRTTLAALLSEDGFFVDEVESFVGACQRLEGSAPYDVVLLDRGLGDRDGVELVPLVRAVEPTTRVIVTSGMDDERPLSGVDAVIRKDRGYDVLRARIAELLG